jgi:uncharacterized protein
VKVAIDSSVLIAAQISRAGTCADLVDDVLLHHELILSEFILDEVERKLRVKFGYPATDARNAMGYLRRVSSIVEPADLPPDLCRDTNDIPVLGTAVAGKCSLLVSVDRDLLDLGSLQGIAVIRPGQFWRFASAEDH